MTNHEQNSLYTRSLLEDPLKSFDEPQNDRIARMVEIDPSRVKHIGLKRLPKDKEEQDALAIELVVWAKKPTSFYIEEFPLMKEYNPYRFFKLKQTNEFFAECLQVATYFCGLHLKYCVHTKELSPQYVLAIMPVYNPEYKEFISERWNKFENYIKNQHPFACKWLEELSKESNNNESQSRPDTDKPVQTQTIPEGLP